MADPRHLLGLMAEDAVARWLEASGWRVLATRWRARSGEVDLVCQDPMRTLVAVEVKLRRSGRAGSGAQGLTRRQLQRLRSSLGLFASQHGVRATDRRIDLVEVTPADAEHWSLRRTPGIDAW
jgi:putative endonuclease